MRCVDLGLVLTGHGRHRRAVLGTQRLEHGGRSDPFKPVQSPDVAGQQVVLDDAPVLGSVGADDLQVGEVHQLGPALGFAAREVGGAFGRDHRPRDAQPDSAVDLRAVPAVLDGDLVAEESRRSGAAVGDERLFLVEFQLEVIAQERRQAGLDLLGLGLRPGEPEEVIICVPGVAEPPEAGITGIPAGQASQLLAQLPDRGAVAAGPGAPGRILHLPVSRTGCPARPSGIFRNENCLDKFVQPVQVNVGQDRGHDSALRRTGERGVPFPVLKVSRPEHLFDEAKEPVIMDLLRQDRDHYLVVQRPKAVGDVSLDEPG